MPNQLSQSALYQLAGLRIISDIALPLATAPENGDTAPSNAIAIRLAKLPHSLSPGSTKFHDAEFDGRSLLLSVPDDVRFLIRDGREILVDPVPEAAENDVIAYLLGSAFGALCHQNEILPLHSSAIDINGGCVAFVGTSGAGKSTLIAALAGRGHQVISDDVCFLRQGADNSIMAWPGIGRIRLWQDAVAALGLSESSIQREFRGYNKFLVPVRAPEPLLSPRRLLGVYELEEAENEPTIVRVQGARAVESLIPNVYRLELAEYMNLKPKIFSTCAEIARRVPIYTFSRKKDFELLPAVIEHIECHLNITRSASS